MEKQNKIDRAFILAAGKGERLRPYTDNLPKPMVPLNGRPIIDQVIDRLRDSGINRIVANLHYKGEVLEAHLAHIKTPPIILSWEPELLNTGGGIKAALHLLGNEPFFVVSGDSLWTDQPKNAAAIAAANSALDRMRAAWDPDRMDMLLQLYPLENMTLTPGVGDYHLEADGRIRRALDKSGAYMWTSLRLCHPRIFENTPREPFSFLQLLDAAEAKGRLHAIVHEGEWFHVTTPQDLDTINAYLAGAR